MHDLSCVVHLHSVHSDGTGTVPEIARAARRARADVVLLTDHDSLEARRQGEEGWYGDDVLVLVGTEVSPSRSNHYLAFGIEAGRPRRAQRAGICAAVREAADSALPPTPSRGDPTLQAGRSGMPFDAGARAPGLDGIALELRHDNWRALRGVLDVRASCSLRPGARSSALRTCRSGPRWTNSAHGGIGGRDGTFGKRVGRSWDSRDELPSSFRTPHPRGSAPSRRPRARHDRGMC